MKGIKAIFVKEFLSYFNSTIGYLWLVVFIGLNFWLFFRGFFLMPEADLRPMFSMFPVLFIIFIPAITMRLWAEEKKLGTLEILFSLPLRTEEIILGKFLAAVSFFGISLLLTFPLPFILSFLGNLDWGSVISGYIGSFLFGSTLISLGMFLSGFTRNQIVAFILAASLSFLLYIIGEEVILSFLTGFWADFFSTLSVKTHFESIVRGVIDLRDIVYYLSFIIFFIYANYLHLEVAR
ncbi:MAG: ABC transporter permease subunit [Candidatus Hydrothermales bacterium]